MLRNYIKLALRNLWKRRSFTALNIIGLSVAFGVAILLSMAALFDLSYDRFHENTGSIYRLYTSSQTPNGPSASTSSPVPFTPALRAEVPGIKNISRYNSNSLHTSFGQKELNMGVAFVDEDFFSIFSFPFIKGNTKNPLHNVSDIAITEQGAEKLFGKEDPVGKTILITINDKEQPFTIASVIKKIPDASSFQFDLAMNFQNNDFYKDDIDKWESSNHDVYVQLDKNITAAGFENSTHAFTNLHFKNDVDNAKRDGAKADANGQYRQIKLLPFEDGHFATYSKGYADVSRARAYMILSVALLILFIACVNFINMSIGTSVQRLREIGMRKTLGAAKTQLFMQFWGESILVFALSVFIGYFLSKALLEQFVLVFSIKASFESVLTPAIITGFIISFIVITFLAGGYPALVLSRLGTLQTLKGKLNAAGSNPLRNTLMVVQFTIAVFLISGTLVLQSQLNYMRNKDLGFNKEQVIAFPLNGKNNARADMQRLRNELQGKPGIVSISASDNILGRGKDGTGYTSALGFDYKGREIHTNMLVADYDYLETLDIPLKAGRNFSRQYGNDSMAVVVNEAMVKELQEKDPLAASLDFGDSIKYAIIGVVKDYNFQGFNSSIKPLTIFMNLNWDIHFAYIKVAPQNLAQSFAIVQNAWKKTEPSAEFMGSFLDENIERSLKQETVMTTIITSGAFIAIALSCLGLFAISLLVVAQRTKEIGLRKVVGASVTSITMLLSRDFLKLVSLSILIATPLSWFAMSKWLEGYAYRIDLSVWFFVATAAMSILIAFATISFRTIRAARMNPVESLRTE